MALATSPKTKWIRVCNVADIPRRGGRPAKLGDLEIALFRTSHEGILAVENRCPHKGGKLSEGIVTGHEVVCPLHNWKVNLVTGSAVAPDRGCVRRIPVDVRLGQVFVSTLPEPMELCSPPIEDVMGIHPDSKRVKLGRRRAEAKDFLTQDFNREVPVLSVDPPSSVTEKDYRLRISNDQSAVDFSLDGIQSRYTSYHVPTHLACMMFGFTRPVVWQGVRLLDVLEDLELTGFEFGTFYSWDTRETAEGERFFETLPAKYALDARTLLTFGMNGQPLPKEHGGPLRLVVPFLQGYKSVKWLTWIKLGDEDEVGYKKRHGFIEFPEFYPPVSQDSQDDFQESVHP